MAKNEDGFEAGQQVSIDELQKFNAQQRLDNEKPAETVLTTPKRGNKSVSKPTGTEKAEG